MIIICVPTKINIIELIELISFCSYFKDMNIKYKCLFHTKQDNLIDFFDNWTYDVNYTLSDDDYIIFYKEYKHLLNYKNQKFSIYNYSRKQNIPYENCHFVISYKKNPFEFPWTYYDNNVISPIIKLNLENIKKYFDIEPVKPDGKNIRKNIRITQNYFGGVDTKQINPWGNIKTEILNIISCEHIYTDNYYGVCLAIALDKKLTFVNELSEEQYYPISVIRNNLEFKYVDNKIIADKNKIQKSIDFYSRILSSIEKKDIINLDKIDSIELKEIDNKYFQYRYIIDKIKYGFIFNKKQEKKKLDNLSIIQCVFGDSDLSINATKKAVESNLNNSNYITDDWIFIECCSEKHFEYFKDLGIKYYYFPLNETSKDIFLKEYLWTFGAKKSKYENLCFIDSDFYYCDCDWMLKTREAFDTFDIFQNFEMEIRENVTNVDNGIKFSFCSTKNAIIGATGFNISIKKNILKTFNGFYFNKTADYTFWQSVVNYQNTSDRMITLSNNEYKCINNYNGLIDIGFVKNQYGCHVRHTNQSFNYPNYFIDNHIMARTCNRLYEELDMTDFPKWNDTIESKIIQNTISRRKKIDPMDDNHDYLVESIIQEEKIKYYGEIKDDKLIVLTTFVQTPFNNKECIQKLKFLYSKYLKTKHRFVCLTDEKIPGIECIKFKNHYIDNEDYRIEVFRNDYCEKGSYILYVDNDVIPVNYFTIPDYIDNNTILLNRELYSRKLKYSLSCMHFTGNYQNIYDIYTEGNYIKYMDLLNVILYNSINNYKKIDSIQKIISLYDIQNPGIKNKLNPDKYLKGCISMLYNTDINKKYNSNKVENLNYIRL